MKLFFILLLIFIGISGFSQKKDTLTSLALQSVVVTAYKEKPTQETSLNIASLKIDSLTIYGNYNLTDLLAKTPGVNMLSTGLAIAKPVIRGLYGNRVLVLLSGLKFDNQQWQEEHGLGLSDLGLSHVELIKGPMSVLYGTEAIGGIINLVEEEKPQLFIKESDVSIKFNSNTLGGLLQGGYKVNNGNSWWRIRVGLENNADYSDGENKRVLNSRFDGYNLKATYGFQKKNWNSTTNLLSSYDRFGFIFNDIYTFIKPDSRWSRSLDTNPAHLVLLNSLSSENKLFLKNNSILNFNIGVQSNSRQENEGGGKISLNMHLLTIQYLLKWEMQLSDNYKLILSNLTSFENNKNYGSRKIVPDATMQEANVSAYLEASLHNRFIFENGFGIGNKFITTYLTPSVNSLEKEIHPFSKSSPYYNWFSGITYFPHKALNIKANIATGVRIANLAELSSNGLHEGVFTYEIGNPLMKNEQVISSNIFANYRNECLEVNVSPFYNYFYNYIYLAPTTESWFGFPVFRYKQQNAKQYGTELSIILKPITNLNTSVSYAGMISKTEDGNYTPFLPASKITPGIGYFFNTNKLKDIHVFSTYDYYFAQNKIAPNELATPEYSLLNIGISTIFQGNNKTYSLSLVCNNLLNTAYYDHLSRFKYFGLLNMGRNFALHFKVKFTSDLIRK